MINETTTATVKTLDRVSSYNDLQRKNNGSEQNATTTASNQFNAIKRAVTDPNEVPIKNCTNAAILELPSDGLTRTERQHGWIMIHVLLACYCFWFLATICNEYFVPAIEAMCSSKFRCTCAGRLQQCLSLAPINFFFGAWNKN